MSVVQDNEAVCMPDVVTVHSLGALLVSIIASQVIANQQL